MKVHKLILLALWVVFLGAVLLGGCSFRIGNDCDMRDDAAVQVCLKAPRLP